MAWLRSLPRTAPQLSLETSSGDTQTRAEILVFSVTFLYALDIFCIAGFFEPRVIGTPVLFSCFGMHVFSVNLDRALARWVARFT